MFMKNVFLIISFSFCCLSYAKATNYYIRTDGNNTNNGLSNTPNGAWRSINDALYGYCNWGAGPTGQGVPMLPGDTLFVENGLYQEDGYGYGLKIDGINGTNTNRFVLKAIHKWGARLELTSQYNAFNIINSRGITIDGFDIFAPAGSTNIHSGISSENSEFITIRNCKIHNFGLGGIGGSGTNIIVENNHVYDNSIRNPGNGSGINFYHPVKISNNTLVGGWGVIIRGNTVYNNYCEQFYIPVGGSTLSPPTDGNGIIIDDWNFTQNASGVPYRVPCLIENNVCFNNGGSGIRIYDSDNVTVRNNTCYHNCWVTANYDSGSPDYPSADIGVSAEMGKGNNITVVNNIALSNPSLPTTNNGIGIGDKITNAVVNNNYTNKLFFTTGIFPTPNIIGNNPLFINANTNPITANFRLANNSPAINIGSNTNAAGNDFDGNIRPIGGIVDAGAYESPCQANAGIITGNLSFNEGTTSTLSASGTNNGTWQSSNTAIATVSASGEVLGVSTGTASISYNVLLNGCTASTSVTVTIIPSTITPIVIRAKCSGSTGCNMKIEIMDSSLPTGGVVLQSKNFTNLPNTFNNYIFNALGLINADKIRVSYTNDAANRDLELDYITVAGTTYQSEAATTYQIGVWRNPTDACSVGGYYTSNILQCNGYFHYMANAFPCQNQAILTSPSDDYASGTVQKTVSSISGIISATNKIISPARVIYKAKIIELNAGFSVIGGAVFTAEIGGCN